MTYFRGLRARVLLVLVAAVVPIFGLALIWSAQRDRNLTQFRADAAAVAVEDAAERFRRLADHAMVLRTALSGQDLSDCTALAGLLGGEKGFDAGMIVPGTGTGCATGDDHFGGATLQAALRQGLAASEDLTLATEGGLEGRLVLGLRLPGDPAGLLALRVAPAAADRFLDPAATPFLEAVALFSAGRPIAERHLTQTPTNWWPHDGLTSPGDEPDAAPIRDRTEYAAASLAEGTRLRVIGLRVRPFLGVDDWRVWSSVVELAGVLLAIVAAALWAMDRSVLRWIDYLRRIAIAHSKGHHSVRAQRMTGAPTELAELGESLNLMANDAGGRVDLLRQSSADKSALLLELHHRVKNNFQVITSLLSLLRWEMPAPRRPEFRLVEDFVRAMAVAYRVAYDAGDVTGVAFQELVRSTAESLRDLASLPQSQLTLQIEGQSLWLPLDKAISLGLYLAVTLPPYLDAVVGEADAVVTLTAMPHAETGSLWVAVNSTVPPPVAEEPPLQRRLRNAYLRQLKAVLDPLAAGVAIRIPLDEELDTERPAIGTEVARPPSDITDPATIFRGFDHYAGAAGITFACQDAGLRYRWTRGADLFGRVSGGVTGLTDDALLPPTAATTLKMVKTQVLAQGEPATEVVQLGEPGAERWFGVQIQPLRDSDNNIVGVLSACHEVTPYKAAERRMAVMMREMAHRSKNILAVTEAMARQTLAHAVSLEDFGDHFSARLHSLAGSHDLLTRRDWEGAALQDLLRSQLGHHLLGDPPQITVEGPEIYLVATAIPYLGLALHELSTNAAKHGALSVPQGRVIITWGLRPGEDGKDRLWLSWIEADGPVVTMPVRRGFGADVTKRIVARALRGEVNLAFDPAGVRWQLEAPAGSLTTQRR